MYDIILRMTMKTRIRIVIIRGTKVRIQAKFYLS